MDRICDRIVPLTLCLFLLSSDSWSAEKKKVNILSWWGYLSSKNIKSVKEKCNVEVYVDEYYSSSEFLRRWNENRKAHDIIIFSNTIYNALKFDLKKDKVPNLITSPYHPRVNEKIRSLGLGENTRLFSLAFTGFMWNKKNISIHEALSLEKMLALANDKIVVILDDANEGLEILNNFKFFNSSPQNQKIRPRVVIANDIENLVRQPSYGFTYHWLGGAISAINNVPGDFGIMVHPALSHITADLVSIMSSSSEAVCVYNQIASVDFLRKLQNEYFYFSPYGGINKDDNKYLVELYNNYFLNLNKYRWIKQTEIKEFKSIDEKWKKLKIQLSNQ